MLLRTALAIALALAGMGSAQATSVGESSIRLRVTVHLTPAVKAEAPKVVRDTNSDFEYPAVPHTDYVEVRSDVASTVWRDDESIAGKAVRERQQATALLETQVYTLK